MRANLSLVAFGLLLPTSLVAQGSSPSQSCVATEQALRAVAHDYWAAYNGRDVAALDKLFDDRLMHVTESGALLSKSQLLERFRAPRRSMKMESAEEPENVRSLFLGTVAILSFTKGFKIIHQPTNASFAATARMTETFICAAGKWKVVGFQETLVPNPAREVYKPAVEYFDDYVGRYRFGENGSGGEIVVTRQGDRLFESWGTDKPVEIYPGKFDMFFTPGIPILERFVRDRTGRVTGIVYTLADSEVEAKRVQ